MVSDELKNIISDYFHGKYKLEQFLQSGAFADLYIVKHSFLDDLRVMKIIRGPFESNSNLDLILYGARVASQLKHENIIDIYDAGIIPTEDGGIVYFIMEYIPGGDLNRYVDSFRDNDILIPVFWVLSLIKQIAFGLGMLHSNQPALVHGDLNPNNILLSFNSQDRVVVKLADFGFSREISFNNDNSVIAGTRPYMAPECFNKESYPSTDIYAVGVIFYILLTNHFPYDCDKFDLVELIDLKPWKNPLVPPSEYNNDVSSYLDEIVMKCLAVNHDERFSDAGELLKEVEQAIMEYSLIFDKNDFVVNSLVKKAFRLAKYENKLPEAMKILNDSGMATVLEDTMSSDSGGELSFYQTIKIDKINDLIKSKNG